MTIEQAKKTRILLGEIEDLANALTKTTEALNKVENANKQEAIIDIKIIDRDGRDIKWETIDTFLLVNEILEFLETRISNLQKEKIDELSKI